MRILNAAFEPVAFFSRVREAPRRALLLDYDGTLAPFAKDRARAEPYPGVREVLADVANDGRTRLAVVSGRPLDDVGRLVGLPIELWGSHGLEHSSPAGERDVAPVADSVGKLVAEVARWVRDRGWQGLLETKPFGLALHARAAPESFARAGPEVLARWSGPAREAGLDIRVFDGGVELRPAGIGKGRVVERVLAEEAPGVPAAYLGDDDTDEDAFAEIRGRGLGALVRPVPRETRADVWLYPPDDLLMFLRLWMGTGAPDWNPKWA